MFRNEISTTLARYRFELLLISIALTAFAVVWPVGEYPILDDWAFVKSLEHLHYEGKLVVMEWNPMSLTGHLVWGLIFTKLLGFSFLSTKIAVFCAGLLLTLLVYRFATRHGTPPRIAFLGATALLLNPLFLVHIFMYMTDVTGLVWQWLSITCLSLALAKSCRAQTVLLLFSSIFWSMAFLTRQHGVTVPLAAAAYVFIFDRSLLRWSVTVPAVLPGIALCALGLYWHAIHQPSNASFQASAELVKHFLKSPPFLSLPYIFWSYAVYVGLFVGPLALAIRGSRPQLSRVPMLIVVISIWVGIQYWTHACMNGYHFPYCRNVITLFGMFHPHELVIWSRPQLWDREWGMAVGLAGVISILLWTFWLAVSASIAPDDSSNQSTVRRSGVRFMGVLFAFQLAYIIVTTPIVYDRHLLLLAPTAIALLAVAIPMINGISLDWPLSIMTLAGYAYYGLTCSHDIHAVSRAVFLEGKDLLDAGVPPDQIDGGYAFDGWYMYEQSHSASRPPALRLPPWWPTGQPNPDMEYPWWIYGLITEIEPNYVITADSHVPGSMFKGEYQFEEIDSHQRYFTYWPWGAHKTRVFRGSLDPRRARATH